MAETSTKPYKPFQPENLPFLPEDTVGILEENIWKMGANSTPRDDTDGVTPVRVEEQYEVHERHAMPFTYTVPATPNYWDLQTNDPKKVLLIADGADVFVDFNRQISSDSPKIFNGDNLTITAKRTTRIWAEGVSGNGTLRMVIFKR